MFFLDIAYFAGLVAIAFYGIRHYSILTPTGLLLAATGAAFLDLGENPPTLFLVKLRTYGWILLLVFVVAGALALLPFYGAFTFEKAMAEATRADGLYDKEDETEFQGAVDRAASLFEHAMKFNPTLESIAFEYADFLYRSPNIPLDEVERVLEKGLSVDPYNQTLIVMACDIKAQLGSPDVVEWLEKRIEYRPNDIKHRTMLVEALNRAGSGGMTIFGV